MSASVRALAVASALAAPAFLAPSAHAVEETAPLSADGRYRAYQTGMNSGVKVTDRTAGGTEYSSVDSDGRWQPAYVPDLDWHARHLLFQTKQPLVVDDVNLVDDVYVRDRACPYSDRISEAASAGAISPDGRIVAFATRAALDPRDTNGYVDFYVVDRATDAYERIHLTASDQQTPGEWDSRPAGVPALSADGRFAAFASYARLTPGDTDGEADIYRRDRATGTTELVSATSDPAGGRDAGNPSISADGNVVAYDWIPANTRMRQAWARDMREPHAQSVTEWPVASSGRGSDPSVSADGTLVAFSGNPLWNDEGQHRDIDSIYVFDRVDHVTYRAPRTEPREQQRVPEISANGRYVSWGNAGTTGGVYDRGPGSERPVPEVTPYEPACKPAARSPYRSAVIDDAPVTYLRFGELGDVWTTHDEMRPVPEFWMGAARGVPGALAGDPNTAMQIDPAGSVGAGPFPFAGRDSFSLEAWIRPRNLNAHTRRVFSNEARTGEGGYLVGVRSDGIVFSRYATDRWNTIKAPITPNRWTHVVATFDGAQQVMRLYLDGERAAVGRSTILLPPVESFNRLLFIGALRGQFRFFNGEIDEAAIYDKVLQPERVAAHHRLGGGTS